MATKLTIYFDTRRELKDRSYPVKIRFYNGQTKYINTGYSLTPNAFASLIEGKKGVKLSADEKKVSSVRAIRIREMLVRAESIVLKDPSITTKQLSDFLTASTGKGDLIAYLERIRDKHQQRKKYNTSLNYINSIRRIKRYFKAEEIPFSKITAESLSKMESALVPSELSPGSFRLLIQQIKSAFNEAIYDPASSLKLGDCPIHRRGYLPPKAMTNRRVLSDEELQAILSLEIQHDQRSWSRDLFVLSYLMNGVNMRDLFSMRWADITQTRATIKRRKTGNALSIPIHPYAYQLIEKHGVKKSPFVFGVFKERMSAKDQDIKTRAVVSIINRQLKKVATDLDIPPFSTYAARYTFTTKSVRSGASLELMQQALGHSDIKTTQNYFKGFENDALSEVTGKLLDFKK